MLSLYCIYDTVALEYSSPFTAKNDGVALRAYKLEALKAMNPDEYKLVCIGYFDNETGKVKDEKIRDIKEIDVIDTGDE